MAVTVKAILNGRETVFNDMGNNTFEATITAPDRDGIYEVTINAESNTGDTDTAVVKITVASWITPKVNWLPTDRFNIVDFNRIRNNILSLYDLMIFEFGVFPIESMGNEMSDESEYWNVEYFNAFEKNIEIFHKYLPIDGFGVTQTFYVNGIFIKYDELNRIENLLLSFKKYIALREAGIRKVPFRLGTFKEIRI